MRIGIFGGTFAPIHKGHIHAAHAFLSEMQLDKLFVIPDRVPPHKAAKAGDDPLLRLEMVKRAFANEEKVEVSDIELHREGKSYTVDTLPHFTPMGEVFLLCGTDMFLTFDTWHRFADIFKMCTIVLAIRDNISDALLAAINEKKKLYEESYGAKTKILSIEPYPISSTKICELIQNGLDYSEFVTPEVKEFIEERGLYR